MRDFLRILQRFHRDQRGLNSLEIVMLLAVAALVVSAIIAFWWKIWDWANGLLYLTTETPIESMEEFNNIKK